MAEIHFEVHTLKGGKWRMDGIFPEKSPAVAEAQRLGQSTLISDVKVYQIEFDGRSTRFKQKLVHRESRRDQFEDLVPGGKAPQAPAKAKSEWPNVLYSAFVVLIVVVAFGFLYLRS